MYYKVLQRPTPVLLCTTKYYSSTTLYYKVVRQYYSVLQSTTPLLQRTTPVHKVLRQYYNVLLRYFSVLQSTTPVLQRTTPVYKVLRQYYNVLLRYYSVLHSTTPVQQCTTPVTTPVLQSTTPVLQSITPVVPSTTTYYSSSHLARLLPSPRSRSKWWRAITSVIVRKVESMLFCVMSVTLSLCAPCNVATSFSLDPFSNLCYLACMFGFCIFWDWLSQPPISSITARTKTKKPKKVKRKKHKNRPNSICNYGVGLPTRCMLAARRAKRTRLKKPKIRHRRVAAMKRRKAAQWNQPNRIARIRKRIFAHTQTVPLAFPWVKPRSMQWCQDDNSMNMHKQPLLTGGAGGAHVTKRKRRWHTQHQNEHQNSLANTLLTVLQQWQQNPGSQSNDNEPKRKRNKPGRPDWQNHDEWNSYYSWPNISQGQSKQPRTKNDSSLAATLLDVIQQATGKSDQEVAKTVQQAIQTHLHTADSRSPHPEYHQTVHREVSYKPSHTSNRWNKQASVNPVYQLAPAEWTLPPRLGNYTTFLEAIKQNQEIKHTTLSKFSKQNTWTHCEHFGQHTNALAISL